MRKKASLQDLYRLYQVVARIPRIIVVLSDLLNSAVESVIVSPLKDTCEVRILSLYCVMSMNSLPTFESIHALSKPVVLTEKLFCWITSMVV